jgi:anthranilate/para-aminobenzoate synthase component I
MIQGTSGPVSEFIHMQQLCYYLCISFAGGWVGYFSYDTVRYVEKKKLSFFGAPLDDRGLPDVHLGLYTDVIVFDHVEKVIAVLKSLYCVMIYDYIIFDLPYYSVFTMFTF